MFLEVKKELNKQLEKGGKDIIMDKETIINKITDEEVKNFIKKLITEDKENFDKKTGQYLGRFEIGLIEFSDNIKEFETLTDNKEEEGNVEELKDRLIKKLKNIFGKTQDKLEKVKYKIMDLYKEIKYKVSYNDDDRTWDLDYKILKLIEKNLPNYNMGFPAETTEKLWELIKAKLVYIAKRLIDMEENLNDCVNKLMREYSIEWKYPVCIEDKIIYIKLRYWYLKEEDFKKKLNECYKERNKLEEEFKKLLSEYLFNLWD